MMTIDHRRMNTSPEAHPRAQAVRTCCKRSRGCDILCLEAKRHERRYDTKECAAMMTIDHRRMNTSITPPTN